MVHEHYALNNRRVQVRQGKLCHAVLLEVGCISRGESRVSRVILMDRRGIGGGTSRL